MTREEYKAEVLRVVEERRGFVLPVHRLMAEVDPELLRRYDELSSYVIRSPEPRALGLKTRFLVLVGITTAVNGDPEGIEWSAAGAMRHGASEEEVLEAMVLAALPAGIPAVESAARVWDRLKEGGTLLESTADDDTPPA